MTTSEDAWDSVLSWSPKDFSWSTLEITTAEKHSGNASLKISNRVAWWATAYQLYYTFAKKEPIEVSAWVKLEAGSGERLIRFAIFDKTATIW